MAPIEKMAVKLKALREKRGLSQEQLAAAAGISRTYLARLETARHEGTAGQGGGSRDVTYKRPARG